MTASAAYSLAAASGQGWPPPLVKPLTEQEIRAAFVNCTKGEAKRANIPAWPGGETWGDLDFLGWRDPKAAPDRAYLAVEVGGRLVAITLRCPGGQLAAFVAGSPVEVPSGRWTRVVTTRTALGQGPTLCQ